MAVNEILSFGTGGTVVDGDVMELVDYAVDPQRTDGHQLGIARRELMNTTLRQVSHMAAGLAQFIANRHAPGVVDDGDLDKVEAGLATALLSMIPDLTVEDATTTVKGLVELATVTETLLGESGTHAVTPEGLAAVISNIALATTTVKGLVELATVAETLLGESGTLAVTPEGLQAVIDALPLVASLGTRTSTGTWTITGVMAGKPLHIISETSGAANGPHMAAMRGPVTGVDNLINSYDYMWIGSGTSGNTYYSNNHIMLVPNSSTVSFEVSTLQGDTILTAYQ